MLAHIAGMPVEETTLSFAPIAVAVGGALVSMLGRIAPGRRARSRLSLFGRAMGRGR